PEVFYIIQRGTVQVVPFAAMQSGHVHSLSLGAGECFSVSALLEKRPEMAPYTAVTDTFCYEYPAARFPEFLDGSPLLREFATDYLASMLRESRRMIRMNFTAATEEQRAMSRTLRSLVTRPAVTCMPQAPVEEVLRSMQDLKVGSMLVIDEAGHPAGIFT